MGQSPWKSFASLKEGLYGTQDRTLDALRLIAENLFLDETLERIATANLHMFEAWSDGIVAVSNRRIFVSGASPAAFMGVRMWYAARAPQVKFTEFPLAGSLAHFTIGSIPVQAIVMPRTEFDCLRLMVLTPAMGSGARRPGRPTPTTVTPAAPPDKGSALEAVQLIQKLADLFQAGILSQLDFDSKKAELLKRI